MAAKTKAKQDGATGTVQARRAAEADRQKAAAQLRSHHAAETSDARKATAKRLADKPTDSRSLADPDPVAGIL